MAGDRFDLVADASGHIQTFIEALQRFPAEPRWCVVGGFAVNIRISEIHRFTNDLDTVSRSQAALVDALAALPVIDKVSGGRVRLTSGRRGLDIDIMADASEASAPINASDRAFASARRMALDTSDSAAVRVVGDGRVTASADIRLATIPALIAMKAVAIPRRADSNNPNKAGSDIHDLYRLVIGTDIDLTAAVISEHDPRLGHWVGRELVRLFSPERDLRYTYARLQRYHPTDTITEPDLAVIAELGNLMSSTH